MISAFTVYCQIGHSYSSSEEYRVALLFGAPFPHAIEVGGSRGVVGDLGAGCAHQDADALHLGLESLVVVPSEEGAVRQARLRRGRRERQCVGEVVRDDGDRSARREGAPKRREEVGREQVRTLRTRLPRPLWGLRMVHEHLHLFLINFNAMRGSCEVNETKRKENEG
jgi:hypothetical protein